VQYLSKYISKGAKGKTKPRLGNWWPSQWWGRSKRAREIAREYTLEIEISEQESTTLSPPLVLRAMGKRARSIPWTVWDCSTGESHGTWTSARLDWGDVPGYGDDWLGSLWTMRELLDYIRVTIPEAWERAKSRNESSLLYHYESACEIVRDNAR